MVARIAKVVTAFFFLLQSCVLLSAQEPATPDRQLPPSVTPPGDKTLINDVEQPGPGVFPVGIEPAKSVAFDSTTPFASGASRTLGLYLPVVNEQTPVEMKRVADRFLGMLDDEMKSTAMHLLDSRERSAWTNLPAARNAGGLAFRLLNENQMKAACDLLATLLSEQGYQKIRTIMLADDQLLRDGRPRNGFGAENFSLVVFGEPSETEMWAVQLDGHHVGLNLTIKGKQITMGPSFIGTQPVSFKLDGNDISPMKNECDRAFRLVGLLTEKQFRDALAGDKRQQIQTGPGKDGFIPKPQGIACKSFDRKQKLLLGSLIASWVNNLPQAQANKRMKEIWKEIDQMHFSWHGLRKPGSDVSFTIQGPSLIIEFAYQDLGGNPLQHLHTQYRHLTNDYGNQFAK